MFKGIKNFFFKAPEKKENPSVAEEIKITNIRNYYNDSLENEPEDNGEEEVETEDKKEEGIEGEKKEEKKEEKNINIEEIIEVKKNEQSSNRDLTKSPNENNKEVEEDNQNKYGEDKTSYCHFIILEGEDIDISRKNIIECAEQTSGAFFLFKKRTRKLVFIEEKFLYILKDITINKNDNRLRRVLKKYDISKLCNIEAKADKTNKFIFKLQFLKNDYFDRETRTFIFDEQRGTIFYELIAETLEKVESTFFNDLSDDDEEDEEDEKDDKGDGLEISGNEIDLSAKSMNKIGFDDKNNDLISTSIKKII